MFVSPSLSPRVQSTGSWFPSTAYWYSLVTETLKERPAPFFVGFAGGHGPGMLAVLVDHITERQDDVVCFDREVCNWILRPCRPDV